MHWEVDFLDNNLKLLMGLLVLFFLGFFLSSTIRELLQNDYVISFSLVLAFVFGYFGFRSVPESFSAKVISALLMALLGIGIGVLCGYMVTNTISVFEGALG